MTNDNTSNPHPDAPALDEQRCRQAVESAEFGVPIPIVENLYLVRVPLPHNPLKTLNSYIALGDKTTTIIDVGFNHPACEQALSDALATLGRSWDSVEILLTHSHPDHTGNLDRIYRDGMPLYANLHSFQEVENFLELESHVFGPLLVKAATPKQSGGISFERGYAQPHVSAELLPLQYQPAVTYICAGDVYRCGDFAFEVIETPGHDPWHICLYDRTRKIMIIGDHVLERITPSITSWISVHNALAEFMDSLGKISAYDVDVVLPAHGVPFSNLRKRVEQLIEHHEGRLDEIYGLVAEGYDNVVSISSHASWKYPNWHEWPLDQKFFSMGETLAHLIYLVNEGKLKQTLCGDEYRYDLP